MEDIRRQLEIRGYSEYQIFLNFMTSLIRECDYIEESPLSSKNEWEIALFTLNWNTELKLVRYLTRLYSSTVISYLMRTKEIFFL